MEKQVVFSQIEILPNGCIGVRLDKRVVDIDGTILANQYHRFLLGPTDDLITSYDIVDAHLLSMGWPAMDISVRNKISAAAAVARQ